MKKKFEYDDWVLYVDDKTSTVEVIKDEETRIYNIKGTIIESIQENEYIDIRIENGSFYSFKFEESGALIADIYDKNEEFLKTFACYYFGEDNED